MGSPVAQGRLSIEEALDRFRARTVSELRLLNGHLPRSMRLERREIDRLADDLLRAVREIPTRRDASLLDKAVRMAGGVVVDAIRRRRRKAAAAAVYRKWRATDQSGQPKGDRGARAAPLAEEHLETSRTGATSLEDESRVA